MSSNKKKILEIRKDDFTLNGSPGGLARTHKIIRTQQIMELQFIQLCKQIEKHENIEKRSETQRTERFAKRIKR